MSLTINHITHGSIAHKMGIKKGDVIIGVNGKPIRDIIDYMYYSREGPIVLKIKRGNKPYSFKIKRRGRDIGLGLKPFKIRSCRNRCIFCFVDQLPGGMRKTLYLKDDDYRMSFLYGNYITLANLSGADKKRIFMQRLSPLYISVHTTNNELRKRMLGNPEVPDIIKEIQEFAHNKIKLHTQIVLIPGMNDGTELSKTIKDLSRFYPHVASIAVVPVGITRHRKTDIKPVGKTEAVKTIEIISEFRRRFKRRHGDPIVYASDELYIKAGIPFPPLAEYGDLPQIENGVGMVAFFLDSMKRLKHPKKIKPTKIVTITGLAFAPYLEEVSERLKAIDGLSFELFRIENKFFGPSVTVTGLLTGRDIIKALIGKIKGDCLLIPNVALKDSTFLDNMTLKDIEESLGIEVKVIEPTPRGLLSGIIDGCHRKN